MILAARPSGRDPGQQILCNDQPLDLVCAFEYLNGLAFIKRGRTGRDLLLGESADGPNQDSLLLGEGRHTMSPFLSLPW